ncbi:transcription factor, Myb superfamily [Ostreococcus tauri]|uniref:Transcription factor, Myb superfamily n=1 Tax=Ostreococcus tauri TaxID=70448 RepID=A0A1Y5IK31_OSTTA|nr:transcription factor, Myb superfamily [Ostreococcus tauri]
MKKGFPTVVKSPPRPHPRPIRIAFTDVNGVVDPRTVRSFCEHKELQSELSEGNSNADSIPTPKRATTRTGDGLTAYEREREGARSGSGADEESAVGDEETRGRIGEDDQIVDGEEGLEHHLTCDEYCERLGIEPGPKMTSFTGWVEESVRERLGIASSANEAWERNGGGKWSRPAKGQAKDHAKKMLYKNPNAYFYRHTVGEEQINGDWSEDEIKQFVKVATKYGAGDKWGLFASHIPGRVGYQCSAAYRHIMLPRGLLRDDAWRMTMSGEAVWIGKR